MSLVLRSYQASCTQAIAQYGGRISRFIGDGILAYFCYPQAHEDDAERAVRAALDIVREVPRLRPLRDITLNVRVGMETGQVMIGGLIGEGESEQIEVVGDAPNLAARLQSIAPPNGVIIGAGTQRLTMGLFNCASLGLLTLHGFPKPVGVWQVHGESIAESRFDAVHARAVNPMVGRESELRRLMECWDYAVRGNKQVAVISGEPGVGKSRLLRALRDAVGPSRPYVMTYYCSSYHQGSALYPVINNYERMAGIVHDDSPEQKLLKLEQLLLRNGAVLAEAVPLVATLLSIPFGEHYHSLELTPEQLKERVLELLIRRLRELSEDRPVLCVIENVHWIDPTFAELITRTITTLKHQPVLLAVTGRTPIETLRFPDETAVMYLPLSRLDRTEAECLLNHSLHGRMIPPEVIAEIIARADGIPLFLEELTKTVVEFNFPDIGKDAIQRGVPPKALVPATLHDSLMARLDHMSLVKPVAQLAAVLGRVFTVQLLSAVAPHNWQPIGAAIQVLAAAEIILPVQQHSQQTYQFKHALLQDVAYQSLLRATRRDYHERIARTLEDQFPDLVEAQPEVVAGHFTEAGLSAKAVGYWLRAGRRATQLSSNVEAVSHFERGRALLDAVPDQGERRRIEYQLCLALLPPLTALQGYTSPELERVFERAISLGEELEDTEEIFPALSCRAAFEIVTGRTDLALVHTEEAIGLAKRSLASGADALAGRLLATIKLIRGDPAGACKILQQELSIHERGHHRATALVFAQDQVTACMSYLCLGMWHLGCIAKSRDYGQRSIGRARSLNHVNTLAFAINFSGGCFGGLSRDLAVLQAAAVELMDLARTHGLQMWTGMATAFEGKLLVEQSELSIGIRKLQAGIDIMSSLRVVLLRPILCCWLAEAHAMCGEVTAGLAVLEQGWQAANVGEHWMDAELHRLKGELLRIGSAADLVLAEQSFRHALAVARSQTSRMLELRAANSLARLWLTQNRSSEAYALVKPAAAWFATDCDIADVHESRSILRMIA